MFKVPEQFRIRHGIMSSSELEGNNGAFKIKLKNLHNQTFFVIASDAFRWEHVSVSREDRCPTWPEMCAIKDLFWDIEDCVMQLHPPKTSYVDNHKYCLHLWRPKDKTIPIPDILLV